MAASGQKLIPLGGMNLDVAPQYLKDTQAKFIKNLYYQLSDLGEAGSVGGANTGVLKPLPSNELYCPIELPEGDNHAIGGFSSTDTKELYECVYNSLGNHLILKIDGGLAECKIVKVDPCFNFQLDPKYFIGEGQCHLEIIYIVNPDTQEQVVKKDFYWTDGFNPQGYLRVEDSIATNGFDPELYPYFKGNYNKCALVRMGLPTPDDCIEVDQVPFDEADIGKNNNMKFDTWQFRVSDTDVFGHPSEHGIISDEYYISSNGCLDASDAISRCVNLTFDAGNPLVDKKQIEYRNCNDRQWYLDSVIDLYQGSNLGEWWNRIRNPKINYDPTTNKITYKFCKDKLCDPIDPTETDRTQPEQPRTSQALNKIGKSIALANNKYEFQPFSKENILDKVSIEVTNQTNSGIGESANITIYIRIYNPLRGTYQKVYKKGSDYVFGGIVSSSSNKSIDNIKTDYQQYFAVKDQKGFIGYLIGTQNYAIGVQYYLDESNNFVKDEDFVVDTKKKYFLKYEFNGVPKANYLFTLASHLSDPSVGDIRNTSTYVGGIFNFSNLTVGTKITDIKELPINTCDGDYSTLTSGEMLITYDLTHPLGGAGNSKHSDSTVFDGYVYESRDTTTLEYKTPVELLKLSSPINNTQSVTSVFTDRNGFFFLASYTFQGSITVSLDGYCSCIKKTLAKLSIAGASQVRSTKNLALGQTSQEGVTYYCPDFDISPCSRMLVKGKVQICDKETGVPNVTLVLKGGGITTTDASGNFTLIAHDDVVNSFRSSDLCVIGGSCSFTSCDGGCIEIKNVSFSPCSTCAERIVEVSPYEVYFVNNKGLLSGGRYIYSLNGYDWMGRHGFSQTGDNFEVNIPTLNETKGFGFPSLNMVIPPSVTFDKWIDYVTIGVTTELNYADNYIDWIADKVTFVDNSGKENTTAPTQIRIDYGSLNEYNSKNNFNTTTGWQITPESTTSPRVSDIVQFIRNGDGIFFDSPITALVKYDQTGQYFLINYTDSLKDLKENALIRLANPSECANKDVFFELCGKYEVKNGKIQVNDIPLNAFDTYYQYRQIPVPVTTSDDPDNVTTIIDLRSFGFPFEHHSVTDFWGYKCSNKGRINVKNPYENEVLNINQIALSGALSPNSQLSYLNYFEDSNKVVFNINNTGGIVYVRIKIGMALIVCQYKNFIVGYGDNVARLNANNIVSVPSGEDQFGKPERDTTGDFGCQLFDKSTIREKNGFTQWLDRNMTAILQNNFQQTVDISRYNTPNSTIASWLVKKIKYQQQYNIENINKKYFHAVINPSNFEWILSEFTIGSDSFINQERDISVEKNETISFDTIVKVWKSFYSFTPEYFGYLQGANSGQLLLSFKNGIPYSHSALNNTGWDIFFGVKCEKVYRFIFRTDGFKKVKFQSMSIYNPDSLMWSDLIITENKQISRLLKTWWKKHLYFWSANFLTDTNRPNDNNITEGSNLEGSWIDIRLIGDPDGGYSELYGVEVFAQGQEQTG